MGRDICELEEKGKGTGLGLPTVLGIAQQSGGSVWVYSEPGAGSTFKVYLPVVDAAPTEARTSAVTATPPRGTETVLVVEDDEPVRALAADVLRRHGFSVIEARNGADAERIVSLTQAPIDLLLTDVVMPEMGGRSLAQRLAVKRPGIRVLFMSGYTDDAVVRHGILEAGVAFVQKPLTPSTLLRAVRDALDAQASRLPIDDPPSASIAPKR